MHEEGYILIAANKEHYLELAVSAACSLRFNDDRPIALLISGGLSVPKHYAALFDYVIAFDPKPPFDGMFVRRFVLEDFSPFQRCMHVDADCLLISDQIDRFWDMFREQPFGVMAQLQTEGTCYKNSVNVDEIVGSGVAKGVYVTNWGVFFYANTGDNIVLQNGRRLLTQMIDGSSESQFSYRSRPGEYSDEPLWGIGLAQTDIEIPKHDYTSLLQLTSPNTFDHHFDYEGKHFHAGKGGFERASGQFYHFAAMNPLTGYLDGVKFYRGKLGVGLPDVKDKSGKRYQPDCWAEFEDQDGRLFDGAMPSFAFATSQDLA